jgi:hypothetical protein
VKLFVEMLHGHSDDHEFVTQQAGEEPQPQQPLALSKVTQ